MKANELRIGNLVNVPRKEQSPFRVDYFDKVKVYKDNGTYECPPFGDIPMHPLTWDLVDIEGIVLTPDILEKCGFRKDNESYFNEAGEKIHQSDSFKLRTKNSKLHIRYLYQTKEFLFWLTYNYEPERNSIHSSELFYYKDQLVFRKSEIYLHQLQNLIHALTGEELEVKL